MAALPGGDYAVGAGADIADGLQNPQNVLDAIRDRAGVADKPAARAAFLQRMHKEIAIAKLTAFLGRDPAVAEGDLPVRTGPVATAGGGLTRAGDTDYQVYVNFIRNHGAYTATTLGAFVTEMINAKGEASALAQINV